MKKFLLSMMLPGLASAAVMAATPVFPDEFKVSADSRGVIIDQYIDDETDRPMIEVSGVTDKEYVTLTFERPDGWTGVLSFENSFALMKKAPVKKAPVELMPIEEFLKSFDGIDITLGLEFELPADEEYHLYSCFLYVGDEIEVNNGFMMLVHVRQGEVPEPADPVFPESFNVTTDVSSVEVAQYIDEETEVPTIGITGKTDKDELTVTIEVPEGWDGIIGGEIKFGEMKKARSEWPTIEEFREFMGGDDMTEGNVLKFPVDGVYHIGQYFLYVDGQVDTDNGFAVVVMVEKDGQGDDPEPEFPKELNVKADVEGISLVQTIDEETGALMLTVDGETDKEMVTLTFDLPEEWDGLIGGLLDVQPVKRARAEWPTIDEFRDGWGSVELTEGKELSFPALDPEMSSIMGQYFLYTGESVDTDNAIVIVFNVKKSVDGVELIPNDVNDVRYFNIHGVEVTVPENGLYIKVSGGKAEKFVVK